MHLRRPQGGFPPHSPLRSFALGGLVGAAGAVATARRLRRSRAGTAAGLAAFEDAPCFLARDTASFDSVPGAAGGGEREGP